ncbi:hypothetical protein QQP08_007374 [Theobroma cacao]|nr:hypothetical protein QQP08_007374 [Theobroma cacao]
MIEDCKDISVTINERGGDSEEMRGERRCADRRICKRVGGIDRGWIKREESNLLFSNLRKGREETRDELRFSQGDHRVCGDQSELTMAAEKRGSKSKERCQVTHARAREESYMNTGVDNIGV